MVVAAAMIHVHNGLFMNWAGTKRGEGFEFHLLVVAMAVAIVIRGAGALSIDRLIFRSMETEASGRPPEATRIHPAA
jgi:putative oxidoreductase